MDTSSCPGPELKYNYVIIGVKEDYTRVGYEDLRHVPGVALKEDGLGVANPFIKALFRLHWSVKLNSIVALPFKKIWFSKMCSPKFDNDRPVCYIFLGGQYITQSASLNQYIHTLNPHNRAVIKYGDLIKKKHYKDFEAVRKSADLLITYDEAESKEYQILFNPMRSYCKIVPLTEPEHFDYDVYFLGYAKDRLEQLLHTCSFLSGKGLRCHFLIAGVPENAQKKIEGVTYTTGISYAENIQNVLRSKAILEIQQGGTNSGSLRMAEALSYHRLLLTNWEEIVSTGFYVKETTSVFSKIEEADLSLFSKAIDYSAFSTLQDHLSPLKFLAFLDEILSRKL